MVLITAASGVSNVPASGPVIPNGSHEAGSMIHALRGNATASVSGSQRQSRPVSPTTLDSSQSAHPA